MNGYILKLLSKKNRNWGKILLQTAEIHEGKEKTNMLKESCSFLITFLYKFRPYWREHLVGLEADSLKKNVTLVKAGILSNLSSCQEPK